MRENGYFVVRHWESMPPVGAYEDVIDCLSASAYAAEGRRWQMTSSGVILEDPGSDGRWTKIEHLRGAGHFEEVASALQLLISNLMGEPYVLFKDKINHKWPGWGGFDWHQDFESYRHYAPTFHVTAMVSLTSSTQENGCLSFAKRYRECIRGDDIAMRIGDNLLLRYSREGPNRGNLEPDLVARFESEAVETQLDDIVLFDSFVPHCSSMNRAAKSRTALFLTFNRLSEGTWYADFYAKKRCSR